MMARWRSLSLAIAGLAWSVPAAAQVASASSQASSMATKMIAAGIVFATLALVIAGYFFMAGHGDRQTLALWAAGFIIILAAPFIASLLT